MGMFKVKIEQDIQDVQDGPDYCTGWSRLLHGMF
jgi:hypothetical protein